MSVAGRIPCLNPRCLRTADAAKFESGCEIVCGKCWRNVPQRLRDRHRELKRRDRRMMRLIERRVAKGEPVSQATIDHIAETADFFWQENWGYIRACFLAPSAPVGIEGFLQEVGLA